jgi:hypothetical protein
LKVKFKEDASVSTVTFLRGEIQVKLPVQNNIERDNAAQNEEKNNQLIAQFWQQTKLRYDYQEIQGEVHEFLYETAQSISGNS